MEHHASAAAFSSTNIGQADWHPAATVASSMPGVPNREELRTNTGCSSKHSIA